MNMRLSAGAPRVYDPAMHPLPSVRLAPLLVFVAITAVVPAVAAGQLPDPGRVRIPPDIGRVRLGPQLGILQVRRADGSAERVRIGDRIAVEVLVRNTGDQPATVQAGTPGDPRQGEGPMRYGHARTIPPGETVALPLELVAVGNRFRGERFRSDVFLFVTRGSERGLKPLFEDGNGADNRFTAELGFRPPTERAVRLLAYNVQFLPPIVDDSRCIGVRASLIAREIGRRAPLPDIIALSEVFDDEARALLLRDLAGNYPHRTRILGGDAGLEQDGGVMILSRFPIEAQDERTFGSVCAGWDCRADKGVLYARVRTPDLVAHVFATHLEAQTADVKRRQLDIIREFVDSKEIPAAEPVLIAGDFNIDAYDRGGQFPDMLRRLDADYLRLEGPNRYSKDDVANDMASGRSRELIDHVLVSKSHLLPTRSWSRIGIFRSPWWEDEDDWSANDCGTGARQRDDIRNYLDLSDHYAIEAYVQY